MKALNNPKGVMCSKIIVRLSVPQGVVWCVRGKALRARARVRDRDGWSTFHVFHPLSFFFAGAP